MTWRSFTLVYSEPLPTFKIKLFETLINRFLVPVHLQLLLEFVEKRLRMSQNSCKYLFSWYLEPWTRNTY